MGKPVFAVLACFLLLVGSWSEPSRLLFEQCQHFGNVLWMVGCLIVEATNDHREACHADNEQYRSTNQYRIHELEPFHGCSFLPSRAISEGIHSLTSRLHSDTALM